MPLAIARKNPPSDQGSLRPGRQAADANPRSRLGANLTTVTRLKNRSKGLAVGPAPRGRESVPIPGCVQPTGLIPTWFRALAFLVLVVGLISAPTGVLSAAQSPSQPGSKAVPPKAQPAPNQAGSFTIPEPDDKRRRLPLTLKQAVGLALAQGSEVRTAILDRAVEREALVLAERMFHPQFSLTGHYNYDESSTTQNRGVGVQITQNLPTAGTLTFYWTGGNSAGPDEDSSAVRSRASLKFSQPLLRDAGITVGTAPLMTARITEESSAIQFKETLSSEITQVVQAYWDLLLAFEDYKTAQMALRAAIDVWKRNQALLQAGRLAGANLVEAEHEVASSRVQVFQAQFNLEDTNRALAILLDLDEGRFIVPVEGLVYRPVKVSYGRLVEVALEQNHQVLSSRTALKQAQLELKLAQAGALDDLTLQLGASTDSNGSSSNGSSDQDNGSDFKVGISLTVPLGLPRDQLKYKVAIARTELSKARIALRQAEQTIRHTVRNQVNTVQTALKQIKVAQLSSRLAREKYNIELTLLDAGRSTNFKVLSYRRDLVSSIQSEHQAITRYLTALTQLEHVVGTTMNTWRVKIIEPGLQGPPVIKVNGRTTQPVK